MTKDNSNHTREEDVVEADVDVAAFDPIPDREMQALLDVLRRHGKQLRRKGVHKVDVGYRWRNGKLTGEIALRAHVRAKVPESQLEAADIVPKEIEGLPVDVIVSNIEPQLRVDRVDPVVGGVEIGNVDRPFVGTLGAVVFDANWRRLVLSNHHVLVGDEPNDAVGDDVAQPGGAVGNNVIGDVTASNLALDCAVALLNDQRPSSTTIIDVPGGIKGVVDPVLGMRVMKSGRTTDTTSGMVEGVSANEFTVVPVPGAWMELSEGGDSGSIWIEVGTHAAVGLHYGGETSPAPSAERAWAKRMARVEARLGIRARRKVTLGETSDVGPSLTSNGSQLLLGWVGTRNLQLNVLSSTDGVNYGRKVTLRETSPATFALACFRDQFVMAWIGVGNNRLNIMTSRDGVTWGGKVTLGDTSPSGPSLAVLGDRLFIAWRGLGNDLLNVMSSTDGRTFGGKVTLRETSPSAPALSTLGRRLVLAWRGVHNNQLNVLTSGDGRNFTNKLTMNETTTVAPAMTSHGGSSQLVWSGTGNVRANILSSGDAKGWGGKLTLRELCLDGPAITSHGGTLVWAWTGVDRQRRVNTLTYDL